MQEHSQFFVMVDGQFIPFIGGGQDPHDEPEPKKGGGEGELDDDDDDDEPDDEPEPDPRRKPHMVPATALVAERRKFQGRIEQLESKIEELSETAEKRAAAETDDEDPERAKAVRQWKKVLGVDKYELEIKELKDSLTKMAEYVKSLGDVSTGSELAKRQYSQSVEEYALSLYDDSLPITEAQFNRVVSSYIGPEEAEKLWKGDMRVIDSIVKQVKKEFGTPRKKDTDRVREADKVKNLPRTPKPGGNVRSNEPAEEPIKSRADLHNRAWADVQAKMKRDQQ